LLWLWIDREATQLATATVGGMSLLGAVLGGITPSGVVFAFVGVYRAGRRLPAGVASVVTVVTVAVLDVVSTGVGHQSVGRVLGVTAGLTAVLLGGLYRAQADKVREQAALLLAEGAVVREEQARSAALAERARIAREVHDVLAHTLSGLRIQLEAAHMLLGNDGDPARAASHVDRARRLANAGIEETRRALGALRGESQQTHRLLTELVEGYRADAAGHGRFTMTGNPRPLPPDVALTIYRTAQEGLTNVRRHAPGASVDVHLDIGDDAVMLSVSDSGAARPLDQPPSAGDGSGYGLLGMRERAVLLGGALSAGPDGDGWRVILTVPA
jgi:signal transduction histidine kinase